MERMNEILARAASRRSTTRRTPTPAPSTTATSSSATRRATPRRITPGLASSQPAGVTPPQRPITDADTSQTTQPGADVLDDDRILELPTRAPTGIVRQASARSTEMTSIRELAPTYAAQLGPRRPGRTASGASASAPNAPSMRAASTEPSVTRGTSRTSATQQGGRSSRASGKANTPGVCPLCHGAGYVRLDVSVGDPAFGQAIRCQCKEQQIEERDRGNLRRLSNLDPFRDKTFETFDITNPDFREAFEAARKFAKDPLDWLVLRGGPGRGKTHLAAAIANEAEKAGIPVIFAIVPDLLDHLRATFAPNSEMPYDALFDKVREVQLLVLDDFGAENSTAWATEKLFQLINYRYNYRIPTVFTTNDTRLSRVDERITSRLHDKAFVRDVFIKGVDYRTIPRKTSRSRPR